jgi:hypothetical protein
MRRWCRTHLPFDIPHRLIIEGGRRRLSADARQIVGGPKWSLVLLTDIRYDPGKLTMGEWREIYRIGSEALVEHFGVEHYDRTHPPLRHKALLYAETDAGTVIAALLDAGWGIVPPCSQSGSDHAE